MSIHHLHRVFYQPCRADRFCRCRKCKPPLTNRVSAIHFIMGGING